ncbi:MAG: tyrosine-protein phosphatase, partial [Bacilli bacterium]|nr:tyrosine-protein phosphatase [Bacilli bacterium]
IHTEEQTSFINSDDPAQLIEDNTARYGNRSVEKPLPVSFSWREENDLDQKASKYILKISENQYLDNALEYTTKERSIDVYNLKINTQYYYSVTSNHHGKLFDSEVLSFTIEDNAPRNILVEGVENVRDLGGWNIGSNKKYKQGLIYRTAQFNINGYGTKYQSEPTKEGKNTLLNELKIKTEIDLRRTEAFDGTDEVGGITASPLGKSVNYVSCPMFFGNRNIFTTSDNLNSIRLFFNTLANADNYPVAFHCLRGTDRTGALAYVLGALVGMSSDDLMLDYLFSDLANIGTPVRASSINGSGFYVQGIANSEGTTLSEKTKNYLHNTVGVEISTLETIIDILTE